MDSKSGGKVKGFQQKTTGSLGARVGAAANMPFRIRFPRKHSTCWGRGGGMLFAYWYEISLQKTKIVCHEFDVEE